MYGTIVILVQTHGKMDGHTYPSHPSHFLPALPLSYILPPCILILRYRSDYRSQGSRMKNQRQWRTFSLWCHHGLWDNVIQNVNVLFSSYHISPHLICHVSQYLVYHNTFQVDFSNRSPWCISSHILCIWHYTLPSWIIVWMN